MSQSNSLSQYPLVGDQRKKSAVVEEKLGPMRASLSNEDMFFSQARELFEEIVDWLSSDSACGARTWGSARICCLKTDMNY